jgi:hypothetical protein
MSKKTQPQKLEKILSNSIKGMTAARISELLDVTVSRAHIIIKATPGVYLAYKKAGELGRPANVYKINLYPAEPTYTN